MIACGNRFGTAAAHLAQKRRQLQALRTGQGGEIGSPEAGIVKHQLGIDLHDLRDDLTLCETGIHRDNDHVGALTPEERDNPFQAVFAEQHHAITPAHTAIEE
ncbi:hypothetical protein MPHO_01240 [Mycolicibacterium phocaicum]|nr:hypothetical protein MPHO_01240 [Mycolicibacterium phocaicum]